MTGMGMMLKSMGLDPEKVLLQVEDFKTAVVKAVAEADDRLKNIEAQNASILLSQAKILCALDGRKFTPADASRAAVMLENQQ